MHIKPSSSSASSSKNDHDQLLTEMKKNRSKAQGCVCSVYAEKSSRHTVTVKICMSLCTCSTLSVHRHCMHFFCLKVIPEFIQSKICTLHLVTFIFESFEAFKKNSAWTSERRGGNHDTDEIEIPVALRECDIPPKFNRICDAEC